MHIDRTRFLLLTSSIAACSVAVACTVTQTTTSTDAGTSPDATTQPDGQTGDGGSDAGTTADAPNTDTGPTCDDTTVDGGTSCATGVGPDAGFDGGCGADPRANGFCTALKNNLKPRPAEIAIECFAIGPACEGVAGCIATAAAAACPDPAAPAFCAGMLQACGDAGTPEAGVGTDGGAFEPSCEQAVSGMTAAGRSAFQTCYVGNTGCADLGACFSALSQ